MDWKMLILVVMAMLPVFAAIRAICNEYSLRRYQRRAADQQPPRDAERRAVGKPLQTTAE